MFSVLNYNPLHDSIMFSVIKYNLHIRCAAAYQGLSQTSHVLLENPMVCDTDGPGLLATGTHGAGEHLGASKTNSLGDMLQERKSTRLTA